MNLLIRNDPNFFLLSPHIDFVLIFKRILRARLQLELPGQDMAGIDPDFSQGILSLYKFFNLLRVFCVSGWSAPRDISCIASACL